jgi:inward rectifier potassium channel
LVPAIGPGGYFNSTEILACEEAGITVTLPKPMTSSAKADGRFGNGRAAILADAAAKLNVLLSETTTEGKRIRRAQELRLERAHIPVFPFYWTLMHVLDEQSPMHGFDAARVIDAKARVFVTLKARDPTLATVVHDIRSYAPEDIRFGMRYADVVTMAEDGTPVADLTRMGELEPDVGDRSESGWTEREGELE